jgi:hypothetical protein
VYHVLMLELKNHPDLGGDVRLAQVINEAYAVLSDAEKRDEYDRFRLRLALTADPVAPRPASGTSPAASASASPSGTPASGAKPGPRSAPPTGSASATGPAAYAPQAASKQGTTSADLLPDLEEALSTLSAWPPRRVTPPFCKGRLALLEGGPLFKRFGFLPVGSLTTPDPKTLEGFELKVYVNQQSTAHIAALAYNGVLLAGIFKAGRDVLKTDGLLKAFVHEISGDSLEVEPVTQLLSAVEYLDTGDRRRRSKALGLWLVSVSRDPKHAAVVVAGYPF